MDPHLSTIGVPQPFPETEWSLIDRCKDPECGSVRTSLDSLFRKYWSPVYFYVIRYWTRDKEAARDLTQAFFLSFLERDFLRSVEADRGKFRTFVCAALRHFLSNEKRSRKAKKRDPGRGILSIEVLQDHDSRFDIADRDDAAREVQFKNDWKKAVVQAALARLHATAAAKGKEVLVELLVEYDLEPPAGRKPTYDEMAKERGLSVSQVTNGLRWARLEFVEALKAEIREQVETGADWRAEARELFGIES